MKKEKVTELLAHLAVVNLPFLVCSLGPMIRIRDRIPIDGIELRDIEQTSVYDIFSVIHHGLFLMVH